MNISAEHNESWTKEGMDVFTREKRSSVMSKIRGKNTQPEMVVRRLVHHLGYRFRLHRADLPGKPDLAFPSRRKAILVHGCFWHGHPGCRRAAKPKTNVEFWAKKLDGNIQRDTRALHDLRDIGWDPLVVWECETCAPGPLTTRLLSFLNSESH